MSITRFRFAGKFVRLISQNPVAVPLHTLTAVAAAFSDGSKGFFFPNELESATWDVSF